MPRRKVGIVIGQLRREGYSCLDSLLSKVKFPGLLGGGLHVAQDRVINEKNGSSIIHTTEKI